MGCVIRMDFFFFPKLTQCEAGNYSRSEQAISGGYFRIFKWQLTLKSLKTAFARIGHLEKLLTCTYVRNPSEYQQKLKWASLSKQAVFILFHYFQWHIIKLPTRISEEKWYCSFQSKKTPKNSKQQKTKNLIFMKLQPSW